jgi:WD40 repeat protein
MIISEAHTQSIQQVAFDLGNVTRFATCSVDSTIKVWDVTEYAVTTTCYPRREQPAGVIPLCILFADLLFSGWSDGR